VFLHSVSARYQQLSVTLESVLADALHMSFENIGKDYSLLGKRIYERNASHYRSTIRVYFILNSSLLLFEPGT